MREPRIADDVEEIPEYYDDPDEAVLQYAASSLRGMERLERLVESYQQQRMKRGEAEGLLEEGYGEDEHVAFVWEAESGEDDDEPERRIVDSYVVGERLDRVEDEMQVLEREIVETVAGLRDWSGEAEESDGPVKAVSIAYSVVNRSLSGDADQSGSVQELREADWDTYHVLVEYAANRKSLDPEPDTLDRYVSRGGTFRRDDLFGVATDLTLEGVGVLDDRFEEYEEQGRAIAHTATERLREREAGEELVQPFDYELMQEQKAMDAGVEAAGPRRIYQ